MPSFRPTQSILCSAPETEILALSCVFKGAPVSALSLDSFTDPGYRSIFEQCCRLAESGEVVTVERVYLALQDSESARAISFPQLGQIDRAVATTASFVVIVRRLEELRLMRERQLLAKSLADPSIDLAFVRDKLTALMNTAVGGPTLQTVQEIMSKPRQERTALIDQVLYRGGTMLIAGPSKSSKTWTTLDLALSIGTGRPWLGFQTTATPVLFVDLELRDADLHERLEVLLNKRKFPPTPSVTIWSGREETDRNALSVPLEYLRKSLPRAIRRTGAGVVVIDPHYRISAASGAAENSNDDQACLLGELQSMCSGEGAALVLTHHFAKGDAGAKTAIDRASGGGVFARWPDAMVTMTPHEAPDAMVLEFALRSFPPLEARVMRWQSPGWEPDEQLDPARIKRGGRTKEFTPEHLLGKLRDGITAGEWREAVGWSEGAFARARRDQERGRRIRRDGRQYFHVSDAQASAA